MFFLNTDFGQTDSSSTESVGQSCELRVVSWGPTGINPLPPESNDQESCQPPTPEEEAQWRAEEQQYETAIRPAPDSLPRVLAKLDGTLFIAWRNHSEQLCWETYADDGGVGPVGPCQPEEQATCTAICLESDDMSGGDGGAHDYVLGGTAAADAEALRVTQAGGASATYPLVGPAIRGSDVRVFRGVQRQDGPDARAPRHERPAGDRGLPARVLRSARRLRPGRRREIAPFTDRTPVDAKANNVMFVEGWDAVTGVGTPDVAKLLPDLIAAVAATH